MFAGKVIAVMHARKPQPVMTLQGRIGLWLQLPSPGVVERRVLKVVKKSRNRE